MNKQTFTIPDGCKAVSIEQVGNQLITTFEPEFKKGDILTGEHRGLANIIVLDFISGSTVYLCRYSVEHNSLNSNRASMVSLFKLRLATEFEKQLIFDALAKEGKQWNAETLQIEDLKVVPKVGDCCRIDFIGGGNDYLVYGGCTGDGYKSRGNIFSTKRNSVSKSMLYTEDVIFTVLEEYQFQKELNDLGFEYKFYNDTISELKWKPKEGEIVFLLDWSHGFMPSKIKYTNAFYTYLEHGRIFKTEKECEEAIEKIKNVLR